MTTNETDDNKKVFPYSDVFKELIVRIKNEILLLAFGFALILALLLIYQPQIPNTTVVLFISLYLVAVGAYLVLKAKEIGTSRQQKEESNQTEKKQNGAIKWKIEYAKSFNNPFLLAKERPQLSLVHFDVDISIKNLHDESIDAKVYLKSPSQAVIFVWDEQMKVTRRKFGILPQKRTFETSLDIWETQCISPKQIGKYRFHGLFRPHQAFEDYHIRNAIVLSYSIQAKSEKAVFNTGFRKIEIPFEDRPALKSEQKIT